jgi:hypothetical protein
LFAKVRKHVGVNAQIGMHFAFGHGQFRRRPSDVFHGVVGIGAIGKGLLRCGFPTATGLAPRVHRPQLSFRISDDILFFPAHCFASSKLCAFSPAPRPDDREELAMQKGG